MTTPAEQILDIYDTHADAWHRLRSATAPERGWLDRFMRQLPRRPADILDIGCGTGVPVARHLIEAGHRITGIDGAPAMVARAAALFPDHRWLVMDMRRLELGRRFDGLIAWNSFFHLTPADQQPMFALFRRHAAAGAALMFTSGPAHGEAIGSFEGQPLYHGSLAADVYRDLLGANGFEVVQHVVEDPECGGLTVWLARRA